MNVHFSSWRLSVKERTAREDIDQVIDQDETVRRLHIYISPNERRAADVPLGQQFLTVTDDDGGE